jgi:hypothetical protein
VTNDFYDQAVSSIQSEYDRLGYKDGWRFLCVSKQVLQSAPRIALITANPGGKSDAEGYRGSCEEGCAYLVEEWPGRQRQLQKQIQCLFDDLAHHTGFQQGGAALMNASLIGYFIPFRSANLKDLANKKEAQAFGQCLWADIIRQRPLSLIVTIDRDTYRGISNTLREIMEARTENDKSISGWPTGWGHYTADVDTFRSGRHITKLVRLPHLSTYKLFSRNECRPCINAILKESCDHF